jgi:CHAD domain-containing protein
MAKAAEVGLDPREPFARAGARAVGVRAREVFEHAEGVLDTNDIERVHDMRVATRRLRAVMEIFAPTWADGSGSKAAFKAALRDVKDLADALGERRDPDVQIAALEELAASMPAAQRAGVKALADRLRERQAEANVALAAALEHAERTELRDRLLALAEEER